MLPMSFLAHDNCPVLSVITPAYNEVVPVARGLSFLNGDPFIHSAKLIALALVQILIA